MFLARLGNQVWAKLGLETPTRGPKTPTGLPIPELFSGPHSGTFFCTFFAAFPGNFANNVDPADPTKFVAFPGNSTNNVDKKPDLAFLAKQKKVPESPGLVGVFGPLVGGSGPSLAQT